MLRRELTTVEYHTSLPVLFGVKKYADTLNQICQERHINIMTRSNLVEVRPDSNEALFQVHCVCWIVQHIIDKPFSD